MKFLLALSTLLAFVAQNPLRGEDDNVLEFSLSAGDTWYGALPVPNGGITLKITLKSGISGVLYKSDLNPYPDQSNNDESYLFVNGSVHIIYFPGPERTVYLTAQSTSDTDLIAEVIAFPGDYNPCDYGYCPEGKTCRQLPNFGYECLETLSTVAPSGPTKYNCGTNNPCTKANVALKKFFFASETPSKYIQCSEWGQCFVMPCSPGLVWDQNILACNWQRK